MRGWISEGERGYTRRRGKGILDTHINDVPVKVHDTLASKGFRQLLQKQVFVVCTAAQNILVCLVRVCAGWEVGRDLRRGRGGGGGGGLKKKGGGGGGGVGGGFFGGQINNSSTVF